MKFLNKHFIGCTTAAALIFLAIMFIFGKDWTNMQKASVILCAILAGHLWEENVIPGGFFEMCQKNMGVPEAVNELAGIVQFFLIVGFCLLGVCFPKVPFLSMTIAVLGIGEGIFHTIFIKLLKMNKPYTPGMITGWASCVVGAWIAWYATANGYVGLPGWILAVVIMIGCFVIAQRSVVVNAGMSYADLFANLRSSISNRRASH